MLGWNSAFRYLRFQNTCRAKVFRQLFHDFRQSCIFYLASWNQYSTARQDPPAEQAETFPHQPAGTVPFHGEQTEFPAAYNSESGKFSLARCDGNCHKQPCTAEGCTFQALKLRLALQFGAFAQM